MELFKAYDIYGLDGVLMTPVRFGNKQDGGYVVPGQLAADVKNVVTFGVGPDISFEADLDKALKQHGRTADFDFYDHTVGGLPVKKENFRFNKQAATGENVSGILEGKDGLLWKFDIEGGEYQFTDRIPEEVMAGIPIIVAEFHMQGREADTERILSWIEKTHTVFHIHPNNNTQTRVTVDGASVPAVIEMTFVGNKFISSKRISTKAFPVFGIDFANTCYRPDMFLNF